MKVNVVVSSSLNDNNNQKHTIVTLHCWLVEYFTRESSMHILGYSNVDQFFLEGAMLLIHYNRFSYFN